MKKLVIIAATGVACVVASAQGLKFEGKPEGPRFVPVEDRNVGGPAFSDGRSGLTWMRCAVGQQHNAEANRCDGQPDTLTLGQAKEFARGIKGGWRLPSQNDLNTISLSGSIMIYSPYSSRSILVSGQNDRDRYDSFNSCRGPLGFWTTSEANGRVGVVYCAWRVHGQPMETRDVSTTSGEKHAVLLVRGKLN